MCVLTLPSPLLNFPAHLSAKWLLRPEVNKDLRNKYQFLFPKLCFALFYNKMQKNLEGGTETQQSSRPVHSHFFHDFFFSCILFKHSLPKPQNQQSLKCKAERKIAGALVLNAILFSFARDKTVREATCTSAHLPERQGLWGARWQDQILHQPKPRARVCFFSSRWPM